MQQSAPLHREQPHHTSLHLYTGSMTRDLAVEMTPNWYGPTLNWPQGKHPVSFTPSSQEKDHATPPSCPHFACLVSVPTIFFSR